MDIKRVLVISENKDRYNVLNEAPRFFGYNFAFMEPDHGIEDVLQAAPDVIFFELGRNNFGIELLKEIKLTACISGRLLVVMTRHFKDFDLDSLRGITKSISKSLDASEIICFLTKLESKTSGKQGKSLPAA